MNFSYIKMFRNGLVLKFYADASNSGWGGVVLALDHDHEHFTLRDYWNPDHRFKPTVI